MAALNRPALELQSVGALATPAPADKCVAASGINFKGQDMDSAEAADPAACAAWCLTSSRCTHFTYLSDSERCFRKHGQPAEVTVRKDTFISGVCAGTAFAAGAPAPPPPPAPAPAPAPTLAPTEPAASAEPAVLSCTLSAGVDLGGPNMATLTGIITPAACAAACSERGGSCDFFSHSAQLDRCWLKSGVPTKRTTDPSITSGVCIVLASSAPAVPTIPAPVTAPPVTAAADCVLLHGVDLKGPNSATLGAATATACAAACRSRESGCDFFAFSPAMQRCWLKVGEPKGSVGNPTITSGTCGAAGAAPAPVDCALRAWSPWTPCTADPAASCDGTSRAGLQRRSTTVAVEAEHGGAPCGMLAQTRACLVPCTIARDCELHWGPWSACTAEAGTECVDGVAAGAQARQSAVLTAASGGGEPCPAKFPVQTQACPAKCTVEAAPSAMPAAGCGSITCGAVCAKYAGCGWSSRNSRCAKGGKTTAAERKMGSCPVPAPVHDGKPAGGCATLQCGADCNGFAGCGWSQNKAQCVKGGKTTAYELTLGVCAAAQSETPESIFAAGPTAKECRSLPCARLCASRTGCGWNSGKSRCIRGGATTEAELRDDRTPCV